MAKVTGGSGTKRRHRPAIDPDAREQQLISYAIDLVEKRLLEGTASSQETTHFLKLASSKYRLEQEKMKLENELTKAKTESIHSDKHTEEFYAKVYSAIMDYSGRGNIDDED